MNFKFFKSKNKDNKTDNSAENEELKEICFTDENESEKKESTKEQRIRIFEKVRNLVEQNEELKEAVEKAAKRQEIYWEGENIDFGKNRFSRPAEIRITKRDTVKATRFYAYKKKKICILNFASSVSPGGGVVTGEQAQEESICRATTLYFHLSDKETAGAFYDRHWKMIGKKKMNRRNTDDIIYSPDVAVLSYDSEDEHFYNRYSIDVITCAAPDIRRVGDETQYSPDEKTLFDEFVKRWSFIFAAAAKNNVDVLILGAFGCGVFANPPILVVKAFKEAFEKFKNYFETVEFAIYCGRDDLNYRIFKEFLGEKPKNKTKEELKIVTELKKLLLESEIPKNVTDDYKVAIEKRRKLIYESFTENIITKEGYGFIGKEKPSSVEIPKGSVIKGDNFKKSKELIYAEISDKIKKIEERAFSGCSNLLLVKIPNSVKIIGKDSFSWCKKLMKVEISNGVSEIGEDAFSNCRNLASVVIPKSVKVIKKRAFSNCSNLTTVVISNGVTEIGEEAFTDCTRLESVVIPSSVKKIGKFAFRDCVSLKSVVISDGVEEIGRYAFERCISLETVELPKGLKVLERSVFTLCHSLKSIEIPNTVTKIEDGAFFGCSDLENVTIPNSVEEIESGAFEYCEKLSESIVPKSVKILSEYAFKKYEDMKNPDELVFVVPKGTTEITSSLFFQKKGFKSIVIPDSVKSIGINAFLDCNNLETIELPDSIEEISPSAFSGCENLKRVVLSKNIKEIPMDAFHWCKKLGSIELPDGIEYISKSAFNYCTSLKHIVIPSSVKYIGSYAFHNCTALTDVTIMNGVETICSSAFESCSRLFTLEIPESVKEIRISAFKDCDQLCAVKAHDNVLIDKNAFTNCKYLITEISEYAENMIF